LFEKTNRYFLYYERYRFFSVVEIDCFKKIKSIINNLTLFICLSLYVERNDLSRRLDPIFDFCPFREKKSSTPSVLVVVCLAGRGMEVYGVRMGGVRELEGGKGGRQCVHVWER
jgi:hypothetical protein